MLLIYLGIYGKILKSAPRYDLLLIYSDIKPSIKNIEGFLIFEVWVFNVWKYV